MLSIVSRDCGPDYLLVRSRQSGLIEKLWGRKPTKQPQSDYLWHARIKREDVERVVARLVCRIDYPNVKAATTDPVLAAAYNNCWHELARTQATPPFSAYRLPSTQRQKPAPTKRRDWANVVKLSKATFNSGNFNADGELV
jgi:hypothetical protein